MTKRTISVTIPMTLHVDVDDDGSVSLEAVGKTMVRVIDSEYVHEMIAEQMHNTVEDDHRQLMIEGTGVNVDALKAVVTTNMTAESIVAPARVMGYNSSNR